MISKKPHIHWACGIARRWWLNALLRTHYHFALWFSPLRKVVLWEINRVRRKGFSASHNLMKSSNDRGDSDGSWFPAEVCSTLLHSDGLFEFGFCLTFMLLKQVGISLGFVSSPFSLLECWWQVLFSLPPIPVGSRRCGASMYHCVGPIMRTSKLPTIRYIHQIPLPCYLLLASFTYLTV